MCVDKFSVTLLVSILFQHLGVFSALRLSGSSGFFSLFSLFSLDLIFYFSLLILHCSLLTCRYYVLGVKSEIRNPKSENAIINSKCYVSLCHFEFISAFRSFIPLCSCTHPLPKPYFSI